MEEKPDRKTVKPRASAKNKKKPTRDKIFEAALKVFSQYSYKDVNIRMIAQEAKVYHPLVLYHFGSKEQLFKEVMKEIFAMSLRIDPVFFEGLGKMPIPDAVKEFLNRMIDFFFANPEAQKIIFLNMSHNRRTDAVPSSDLGGKHMKNIQLILEAIIVENKINFRGSEKDMRTVIHLFRVIMAVLIGGADLHARALRIDPTEDEYKEWVKKSLRCLFLPWIESLAEFPKDPNKEQK